MTFANLPGAWVIAGLAALAAGLFVLQQLRTRYRDVTVVTTLFWRQVVDEAPVRTLRERFATRGRTRSFSRSPRSPG